MLDLGIYNKECLRGWKLPWMALIVKNVSRYGDEDDIYEGCASGKSLVKGFPEFGSWNRQDTIDLESTS